MTEQEARDLARQRYNDKFAPPGEEQTEEEWATTEAENVAQMLTDEEQDQVQWSDPEEWAEAVAELRGHE